jgi:formate hydrogenlyase subunit 4
MKDFYPILVESVQMLVVLVAGPLLVGWIRVLKCWTQGRSSAGLLQPFRDISRLLVKKTVLADNASWVFTTAPYVVFGSMLLIGAVMPIVSVDLPLSASSDIIVIIALFALGRFFLALAGLDVGTAFGGMGSSREMMVASLAEPAILMTVFTVSLVSHSTSLSHIAEEIMSGPLMLHPSLAFTMLAFILIAIAETGRIPVDNPSTHLELTMIHEAMVLEYSGRHLALIEWAGMTKIFLFASLGIAFFLPWGIAGVDRPGMLPLAIVLLAIKIAFVGVLVVLIETGLSKIRLFRLTEFLGAAFLLATLGMFSYFMLE